MKPVSFTVDSERIVGNLCTATKPQGLAFLFIHGWLGHQNTTAAQALADMGCTSLTYAMRGSGDSEGDLTTLTKADFLTDAGKAYDYLRAQVSKDTAIGVVGSSFGSYLGVLLTEQRAGRCLSLRVPANYPDDLFDTPEPTTLATRSNLYTEWRSKPLDSSQNKALNALHGFTGNVQIIESEQDEQVPHQTVVNYVNTIDDKSRLSYTVMEGATHSLKDPVLQTAYGVFLCNWAKQQLSGL
jgi:esterase/lipase